MSCQSKTFISSHTFKANQIHYYWFPISFLILSFFCVIPIVIVDLPPLVDYLNHIARIHVLLAYDDSVFLQEYYQINWNFIPNLSMDIIVFILSYIFPLQVSGKIFVAITVILTAAGVTFLYYVLNKKFSIWPLLAFMFVYHRLLLWGNMSFSFGIAMALWGTAFWIWMREKRFQLRLPFFMVFSFATFIGHLFGFGIYILTIIGYEIGRSWPVKSAKNLANRNWVLVIIQFILPFFIIVFSPTGDRAAQFHYGHIMQKITPAFHIVNNYNRTLDYFTFIVLITAFLVGLLTKRITVRPYMGYPIILLCIAQILMPNILFGSFSADARLPVALAFLIIASTDLAIPNKKVYVGIFACLAFLFAVRLTVLAINWSESNTVYQRYIRALSNIEEGSKLIAAIGLPRHPSFHHPPLNFISSQAVILRSSFDPFLFADHGHQPIAFKESYQRLSDITPGPVFYVPDFNNPGSKVLSGHSNPFKPGLLDHYDYLLIVNEFVFAEKPPSYLETVDSEDNFRLLDLKSTIFSE